MWNNAVRCYLCALTLAALGAASCSAPVPKGPYADTGWVTLHANPANTKYVQVAPAQQYRTRWHVLQNASALTAPVIGPEGNIYQTTGLGPGHSNLHAYDVSGRLLWQTPPWKAAGDFDSCAIIESPIVDAGGDIYVSDCNQLWAFHADGRVKWVISLPPSPAGMPYQEPGRLVPFNPFVTAVFTKEGAVLGVTVWGQVLVVSRDDGHSLAPILILPGVPASPTVDPPRPATLWSDEQVDPALREPLWQLIFGGTIVSANTPAVAKDGAIFVIATSANSAMGALYKLTFTPANGLRIQWASFLGPGSGSSPNVTPDGKLVYVSDNAGTTYAVATDDGKIRWSVHSGSEAASSTVGPDGRVYMADQQGAFRAYDSSGVHLWTSDLNGLAASLLPTIPEAVMGRPLGPPVSGANGLATITDNGLLVPVTFGYRIPPGVFGSRPTTLVVKASIAVLDPKTGKFRRLLADISSTSEGLTVLNKKNRLLLQTYGCVYPSSMADLAKLVGPVLAAHGQHLVPASCGLEAFEPHNG